MAASTDERANGPVAADGAGPRRRRCKANMVASGCKGSIDGEQRRERRRQCRDRAGEQLVDADQPVVEVKVVKKQVDVDSIGDAQQQWTGRAVAVYRLIRSSRINIIVVECYIDFIVIVE